MADRSASARQTSHARCRSSTHATSTIALPSSASHGLLSICQDSRPLLDRGIIIDSYTFRDIAELVRVSRFKRYFAAKTTINSRGRPPWPEVSSSPLVSGSAVLPVTLQLARGTVLDNVKPFIRLGCCEISRRPTASFSSEPSPTLGIRKRRYSSSALPSPFTPYLPNPCKEPFTFGHEPAPL